MGKFMKNKDNNFSYADDGTVIFFNQDRQAEALRRKYPPKNLDFQI